ncbi:hypothetical protein PIB30_072463, partial [Stylosanthes scabra]|nr:hypothetical protein [Stylosanthes scabra]
MKDKDKKGSKDHKEKNREESEPTLAKVMEEIIKKRKIQGKDEGKGKKKKATTE